MMRRSASMCCTAMRVRHTSGEQVFPTFSSRVRSICIVRAHLKGTRQELSIHIYGSSHPYKTRIYSTWQSTQASSLHVV
eukprot:208291-Chlamydomonas_euryale.AAC.1